MAGDTTRFARVRATMGRAGWSRHAAHTATAGTVQGTGSSQVLALADLAGQLTEAAGRGQQDPVFAWDKANAVLWVAVPDVMHGGHRQYAVRMGPGGPEVAAGCQSSSPYDVSQAFAGSAGTEVLR